MASVAGGDLYNNVQHRCLHDALIPNVSSSKVRWGVMRVALVDPGLGLAPDQAVRLHASLRLLPFRQGAIH